MRFQETLPFLPSRTAADGRPDTTEAAMIDNTPRQIGLRLYAGFCALLVGVLGFTSPDRLYPGAESYDPAVLSFVLLVLSAMAIGDTVINDIMGARFTWPFVQTWRESVYLVIAMVYISLTFISIRTHTIDAHLFQYAINVAACVWIAVFDVGYRYVLPRRKAEQ